MKVLTITFLILSFFYSVSQPVNSVCDSAILISLPVSGSNCITGNNIGADSITYATPICNTSVWPNAIWYKFVSTGNINIISIAQTTGQTAQSAAIIVFKASRCDSILQVPSYCSTSLVNDSVIITGDPIGTTYLIQAASFGAPGNFQLCITSYSPPPASASNCSGALPVCNLAPFTQSGFNPSGGTFVPDCFLETPVADVWYKFSVVTSGALQWLATPTAQNIELDWAVYDITTQCPTTNNQSNEVGCNWNYSGSLSSPVGMQQNSTTVCPTSNPTLNTLFETCPPITVTQGHTYAIMVSNYTSNLSTGININFTGSTFTVPTTTAFTVTPSAICDTSGTVYITNSGTAYNWNFGDGSSSTIQNPGSHFYAHPGTYIISLSYSSAGTCSSPFTNTVSIKPFQNQTEQILQICPSLPVTLTAPALNGHTTYFWPENNAMTQSITVIPDSSHTYTVICSDSNNCTLTATLPVEITSQPIIQISAPAYSCAGDSFILTAEVANSYTWSNSTANTASITVSADSTTTYYVTAFLGNDCAATGSHTVTIIKPSVYNYSLTACSIPFINGNRQYTQTGIYIDTLQTSLGCDSLVLLHLIVDTALPAITRTANFLYTAHFNTYQWLLNGTIIDQANSQSLSFGQNGDYSVVVTDSLGCVKRSEIFTVTDLGFAYISSNYNFKLYPNPTNGNFKLEFNDEVLREVEITDVIGSKVFGPFKISHQKQFNLDQLNEGLYVVSIKENNETRNIKFSLLK